MQHTIQEVSKAVQQTNADPKELGRKLAQAMAADGASYGVAYDMIEHMVHTLKSAKDCISKAAFHELKKDNRRIDHNMIKDDY